MKVVDQNLALARAFPGLAEVTDKGVPIWLGEDALFNPAYDDCAIDAIIRRLDDEQALDYVLHLLPPQCSDKPSFFGMALVAQASSVAKTAAVLRALCLWKQ